MGAWVSISAMLLVAAYSVAFGTAMFMGLDLHMHWTLALLAISAAILLRLWPLLPIAAYYGARMAWGWDWYWALPFALPVCAYIVPHYWIRFSDYLMRPRRPQGA
ncbi:MAG: hypothetical protein H7X93_13090 [Sphingomonadaceae bacterium]|nr:hypothetical protein [Sphingomonadaceae bacterium]